MKWLFLVHSVQTLNSRERVKIWRLTKKVGAVLYRNSVYVLPYSAERLEDFQWLSQQIKDSKGEASVFVAEANSPQEDRHLRRKFEEKRNNEFGVLYEAAKKLLSRVTGQRSLTLEQKKRFQKKLNQLHKSFSDLLHVDFFSSPVGKEVRSMLKQITSQLDKVEPTKESSIRIKTYDHNAFRNKTWTTREHIHIDRLCSAWLIKRFIDPKAKFIFAPELRLPTHAIPFDVFGNEFSHHGDDCTFETLMKAFKLKDRALEEIAQLVHDIDIKDQKFDRPEAPGLDAVVRSLSDHLKDDHKTLEIGSILLNSLYDHFSSPSKK